MRHFYLVSIAGLLFLAACNDANRNRAKSTTKVIDQYLTKHGEACTVIGRPFPIDVPESEQRLQSGTGLEMATLEQAGLLQSSSTTAVVHGMLDALRGSTPPQSHETLRTHHGGKEILSNKFPASGQTNGLCYGQKTVDAIVKWTEPVTAGCLQTEVTYT